MKIQDCLLVIGEITMEKRFLEDKIEQLEARVAELQTSQEEERAEVDGRIQG